MLCARALKIHFDYERDLSVLGNMSSRTSFPSAFVAKSRSVLQRFTFSLLCSRSTLAANLATVNGSYTAVHKHGRVQLRLILFG